MSFDEQSVLSVEGIGKRYRIGSSATTAFRYKSIRESIAGRLGRGHPEAVDDREFWALRDVSFAVTSGERVGVIGRNGAGKSTLLKILARVTTPTEGRGEIRGRVGSLLEVGTGFHPELSGRDNIMLNGAILGMGRREIREKTDQIVEFAGVEQFLGTPVKRYSSGMYLRLAFAVAAHLDPDVLLVDEVLAVGDADFQKKCLGRMEEIGSSGRTVLFVSHSMSSILRLCDRVILLDRGGVVADGAPHDVVSDYLAGDHGASAERSWADPASAPGDDLIRLKSVRVLSGGRAKEEIDIREPIDVEVEYWQTRDSDLTPVSNIHFFNEEGLRLFVSTDMVDRQWRRTARRAGVVRTVCHIPGNFFAEGRVFVEAAVSSLNPTLIHVDVPEAVAFHVVDRSEGDGVRGDSVDEYAGVVRPMFAWDVDFKQDDS